MHFIGKNTREATTSDGQGIAKKHIKFLWQQPEPPHHRTPIQQQRRPPPPSPQREHADAYSLEA